MTTLRRQAAARDAARAAGAAAGQEWDEATLLERTEGLLTALPDESSRDEWDMPALIQALRAGEVQLPLSEAEEQRFRKIRATP